jgi:hypothetical protein
VREAAIGGTSTWSGLATVAYAGEVKEEIEDRSWSTMNEVKMPTSPVGSTARRWTKAFAEKSTKSFAEVLAEDVILEGSVLTRPIVGRRRAGDVLGAASKIHEALTFTHKAECGERTYLEWEAKAFGDQLIAGVTVLTKGAEGQIARIAIHHRPLGPALRFSAELRERLRGTIEPDYFFIGN